MSDCERDKRERAVWNAQIRDPRFLAMLSREVDLFVKHFAKEKKERVKDRKIKPKKEVDDAVD